MKGRRRQEANGEGRGRFAIKRRSRVRRDPGNVGQMQYSIERCPPVRDEFVINNYIVRLNKYDLSHKPLQSRLINLVELTGYTIDVRAQYRVNDPRVLMKSGKREGVGDRLTRWVFIDEHGVMSSRLLEVSVVIGVFIVIRVSAFRHQILAQCTQKKRSLVRMVVIEIGSGAKQQNGIIRLPPGAEYDVSLC